jgi:tetratricopeptide (TPR) repeat protein
MNLDSKSIPVFAAILVLSAAGLFLVGRMLMAPPEGTPALTAPADAPALSDLPEALVAGRQAMREGRTDEARTLLEQIDASEPAYLMALSTLGALDLRMDQPAAAADNFRLILSLEPDDADAYFGLSLAQYALGNNADAEYSCLRTLELAANHAPARFHLALVRTAMGRTEDSIDSYLRAMQFDKTEPRILGALGELTMLHAKQPELPSVHYALAFFANTLGSVDQEVLELGHFLELESTGPAAEQARATLNTLQK